jgi:hypothetical protein
MIADPIETSMETVFDLAGATNADGVGRRFVTDRPVDVDGARALREATERPVVEVDFVRLGVDGTATARLAVAAGVATYERSDENLVYVFSAADVSLLVAAALGLQPPTGQSGRSFRVRPEDLFADRIDKVVGESGRLYAATWSVDGVMRSRVTFTRSGTERSLHRLVSDGDDDVLRAEPTDVLTLWTELAPIALAVDAAHAFGLQRSDPTAST